LFGQTRYLDRSQFLDFHGVEPPAGWREAVWSPSRGIHKDPVHWEALGPSGRVPEEFIDVGAVDAGQAVHVRAVVSTADALDTHLAVGAAAAKAAWLNGEAVGLEGAGHLAVGCARGGGHDALLDPDAQPERAEHDHRHRQYQLEQHPPVAGEAPWSDQAQQHPADERGEGQRDDDEHINLFDHDVADPPNVDRWRVGGRLREDDVGRARAHPPHRYRDVQEDEELARPLPDP